MFFPQFENNLIIITICKGWELRRRVDQCQSFQFYWNLNHPPPPSSCQEEVGFQKLQKPQTAQISPKRNVKIRFVLYCQPKEILIWTDTMKSCQYKQFGTLNIRLNVECIQKQAAIIYGKALQRPLQICQRPKTSFDNQLDLPPKFPTGSQFCYCLHNIVLTEFLEFMTPCMYSTHMCVHNACRRWSDPHNIRR